MYLIVEEDTKANIEDSLNVNGVTKSDIEDYLTITITWLLTQWA